MKATRFVILAAFCLFLSVGFSQTYSSGNQSAGLIFVNNWSYGGSGISMYDFDGDGWDDITIPSNGQNPRFYRNNGNGTYTTLEYFFNISQIKQITWVDYDNDGDPDIFMTRHSALPVLLQNDGDFNFTDVSLAAGLQGFGGLQYGHSWGDYNRDGYLDLYICNYQTFFGISRNYFYENNGDGTFTEKALDLGIDNGSRPSFQSAWFDYDNDGWPDLFVINDYPANPNFLYRNNGNGTFTDVSVAANANQAFDAMSISIGDYDGDGWFDIYMSNLPEGNRLLRNTGNGTFENIPGAAGASVGSFCWGTNWLDYNNDGVLDIFSAASLFPGSSPAINHLCAGNGNGTFTLLNNVGFQSITEESYGSAIGDVNNDGYPDIMVNNRTPSTARLMVSSGGTNNWVKITLHGTVSNSQAIGSRIELSAGGQTQYKYTMCGDNYLSQDSQHVIFGLGQNTLVDSVVVKWPSGLVETFYNLSALMNHNLVEGSTIQAVVVQNPVLCPGDSAWVSIPGYDIVNWSNGISSDVLTVTESGEYFGTIHVGDIQAPLQLGPFVFSFGSEPSFSQTLANPSCYGFSDGQIELVFDDPAALVTWQNEMEGWVLGGLTEGTYSALVADSDGCEYFFDFVLQWPDSIAVSFSVGDVLCFDGNDGVLTILESLGGTGIIDFSFGFDPDALAAGLYSFQAIDGNGCMAEYAFEITEPEELIVSLETTDTPESESEGEVNSAVSGGTPPYSFFWSTGDENESLTGLEAGLYSLWVMDDNGCLAYAETVVNIIPGVIALVGSHITLYPNPFNDQLHFGGLPEAEIEIFSPDGRSVYRGLLREGMSLSTFGWSSGFYFAHIWSKNETWKTILMKQ